MSTAARIASNTVVQLVGKFVGLTIGLVLVGVLTRRLGVSNYGDYVIALTVSGLFAIFADLGVNVYVLKRLSTRPPNEARVLGSAMGLRLLSLSIMMVPAFAISFLLPYARVVQLAILIALVSSAIQTVNSLFVMVLQARLQMHYAAASEVVGRALTLALTVLFLVWTRSVLVVLFAQVIGSAATCLLTYRWARSYVVAQQLWQPATWRGMLRESVPIGVSTVFSYLYFKSDMVILSLVAIAGRDNRVEVGIYGIAYKLLEVLILVPSVFAGTVFPVLSDFLSQGDQRVSRLIDRTTRIVLLLGGGVAAGLSIYASEIIGFVAGPEYANAVVPLRILSLAVFLIFVGSVYTYMALALNQQVRLVWLYGSLALLNIATNLVLIPRYSYVGAAWVAVFTDLSVLVGSVLICRRSYPLEIRWSSQARLLAALSAVALASWGLSAVYVPLSILVLVAGVAIVADRMHVVTWSDLRDLVRRRAVVQQSPATRVPE
ncbi:MAG: flippase [Candidatus Latescibacterota bacterium]|nr:MAG: flippase [Candidatus Latescibacterota bacterium]